MEKKPEIIFDKKMAISKTNFLEIWVLLPRIISVPSIPHLAFGTPSFSTNLDELSHSIHHIC